jgi:hypothetical protein
VVFLVYLVTGPVYLVFETVEEFTVHISGRVFFRSGEHSVYPLPPVRYLGDLFHVLFEFLVGALYCAFGPDFSKIVDLS